MIELILNGISCPIPEDFEIEINHENPYFTKTASYSLDIELNINYTPETARALGFVNRITTSNHPEDIKATLIAAGHVVFNGHAVLLSVTRDVATLQLMDATSYFNFIAKKKFIDEMKLTSTYLKVDKYFNPYQGMPMLKEADYDKLFGSVDQCDYVLYPESEGEPKEDAFTYGPNFIQYSDHKIYFPIAFYFFGQPYLIKVIENVLNAAGYSVIRNDLNTSFLRNLYICNTFDKRNRVNIGYSSTQTTLKHDPQYALPHWQLNTFVDEIEKLCACIFVIDDFNGVSIISLNNYYNEQESVLVINDDDVLDEYELNFEEEEESKDLSSGNIEFDFTYSDKFLKVEQDVIDAITTTKNYDNFDALQKDFAASTYAKVKNTRFVDKSTSREYIAYKKDDKTDAVLREINVFGNLSRDGSDNADVSLKIVPANTVNKNVGWWFSQGYDKPSAGLTIALPFTKAKESTVEEPDSAQDVIENSTRAERAEEAGNIEVMLATGDKLHMADYQGQEYRYPIAFSDFKMNKSYKEEYPQMSLSLKDVCANSLGHLYRSIKNYHSSKKYVIRFYASKLPDSKKVFLIHNQKYVCRKITARYTNNTNWFRFEGEFYKLT